MKTRLLYCISLVLVMLVTGVFWGTWFTLTRSLNQFPPDNFIRIGKTIIANVAGPMRILMPATIITLILLCIATIRLRPSFYLFVGALVLMIITLLITVGVEVPIDNQIKTWETETLPSNWTELRATWDSFHTLRTITSILSFIILSIGVVIGTSTLKPTLGNSRPSFYELVSNKLAAIAQAAYLLNISRFLWYNFVLLLPRSKY